MTKELVTKNFTQEIKDKWLAALRSGKYQKGRRALYTDGKFCCLGVAAVVICGYSVDMICGLHDRNDHENSVLPDDVAERIGLTYAAQSDLAMVNDFDFTYGDTFTAVIARIEKDYNPIS
jgi:hypothetical protein